MVPVWAYWLAALISPPFIAIGAILCIGLSLIIGQEPATVRSPRGWLF